MKHHVKRPALLLLCAAALFSILPSWSNESYQPLFSTAGFFALPETGREVYNMNPAWRFYKGPVEGAERNDFDDRSWRLVSLPDGMEYLPTEASGCINYQGEVWYRKHFTPDEAWRGRRQFLHFEAIMGKSKVWLNGVLLQSHYGGYLPVIVDITPYLKYGQDNVIAVWADNSDAPAYPPGKEQAMLDFAYFGGIYRDCWLVVHNPVFITDPNYEDEKASGGLFVSYDRVSEQSAVVHIDTHIRNASNRIFRGRVVWQLYDHDDKLIFDLEKTLSLAAGKAHQVSGQSQVLQPRLWSPDSPHLYKLHVYVQDTNGKTVDGYYRRIGIRSIEFKGEDGFWLNGKPYPEPLIGANRHQDFAVIGNALSNSLHWRDAKKLRDAGLRVIRNAHYPQDPAFMDACDELGLTYGGNGNTRIYHKPQNHEGMPSPVITFKGAFDVMQDKELARNGKHADSYLLAEGVMDGKVVATHKVMPSRRPSRLLLWADDERVELTADGSDLLTVVAAVADDNGNIKRLNNYEIKFEIEGPGELVANEETFTNPRPVLWGTAPVLVRATTTPGEIKVRASVVWSGKHTPVSAELTLVSHRPALPIIADSEELKQLQNQSDDTRQARQSTSTDCEKRIEKLQQELNRLKLKEVEQQQSDFE